MAPSYRRLQQYAIAISVISVIYNGAEGAISIGFGAESSSRALIFFGIQSAIEVISAAVVIWRFKTLAKPGEERKVVLGQREIAFERRATLIVGILLVALFVTTEASSIATLVSRQKPDSSIPSLIISASALVIMVMIWLPKRYLARALDSSAMKGEATCSLSCIQITIVLFIGSLIYRLWKGGWWVDAATAMILGFFFGWEGVKMVRWARNPAFTGGCCGDCKPATLGQVELGTQYRDTCSCCKEKQECREAGSCACSSEHTGLPTSKGCCTPIKSNGDMCCTGAILRGPRLDCHPATPTQPVPSNRAADSIGKIGASDVDSCCSPKSGELELGRIEVLSVPDEKLDTASTASASHLPGNISNLPMPPTKAKEKKSGCHGGCCSGSG